MSVILPTVFCVSTASLMKEISPLLQSIARSRWIANLEALNRTITAHSNVNAFLVEVTPDTMTALDAIKLRLPVARRIVMADAGDLKLVRSFLETGAAHEIIYRPVDMHSLKRALGIRVVSPAVARSASSLV